MKFLEQEQGALAENNCRMAMVRVVPSWMVVRAPARSHSRSFRASWESAKLDCLEWGHCSKHYLACKLRERSDVQWGSIQGFVEAHSSSPLLDSELTSAAVDGVPCVVGSLLWM